MFTIEEININDCYQIHPKVFNDHRGKFVKVFQQNEFKQYGLEVNFAEEYYSHSRRGVIRGMHFQKPPADHAKMIYCVQGEVFDVVLDLRKGSPTYLQSAVVTLSDQMGNMIFIPKGVAHGFCATSEIATLIYKVSTVYDPVRDSGVLWSSIGIDWPTSDPIVSKRDATFLPLSQFESPFIYE